MSQLEFIGCIGVYGLVFITGIIGLVKPVIALNINIQKLSDSIKALTDDNSEIKSNIVNHDNILNDHETRLTIIEKNRD